MCEKERLSKEELGMGPYGRETLPSEFVDAYDALFDESGKVDEEKIIRELNEAVKLLEDLVDEFECEEAAFKSKQPENVRRVQFNKKHVALVKLARCCGSKDTTLLGDLRKGAPTTGPVGMGNHWKRKHIPVRKSKFLCKQKLRTKPPSFMTRYNLIRLEEQVEKLKAEIGMEELSSEELEKLPAPVYAFGTEQGPVVDKYLCNGEYIEVRKKLRL